MFIGLNVLCIIIVFFIGADVFSLADEIAYCKEKDIDILKRKYSTCRECGHRLRLKDTFPVISRFVNKGKCRFCDAEFSKRGFNTEVVGGIFAVLIYVVLYYICKLKIFYAAAIMIAVVIVGMIIVAWYYAPHEIKEEEKTKEKKTKEKKNKEEKNKEKEHKENDIALIEFNFDNKDKEE